MTTEFRKTNIKTIEQVEQSPHRAVLSRYFTNVSEAFYNKDTPERKLLTGWDHPKLSCAMWFDPSELDPKLLTQDQLVHLMTHTATGVLLDDGSVLLLFNQTMFELESKHIPVAHWPIYAVSIAYAAVTSCLDTESVKPETEYFDEALNDFQLPVHLFDSALACVKWEIDELFEKKYVPSGAIATLTEIKRQAGLYDEKNNR